MIKGKKMKDFLAYIFPDQNVTGLSKVEDQRVNENGRTFFKRQDLQPVFDYGYYDPNTGKVVLGNPLAWKKNAIEEPDVDATSAAKHTIAFTEKREILAITRVNNNRAFYVTLSLKRSGGTEREIGVVPNNISGNDPAAGQTLNLMANFQKAMEGPFIVGVGDEIYTNDEAFVAADVCLTVILSRKVN